MQGKVPQIKSTVLHRYGTALIRLKAPESPCVNSIPDHDAHSSDESLSEINQFDNKAKAWSALFSEPMSDLVKRYTASVFFDKRLWQADITGSLAHAEMLAAQGIITAVDHASIQRGMAEITASIEADAFDWKLDLEDVHLNIEARLTQIVGDAGKRLHTGRSRNDQVATDVRLCCAARWI